MNACAMNAGGNPLADAERVFVDLADGLGGQEGQDGIGANESARADAVCAGLDAWLAGLSAEVAGLSLQVPGLRPGHALAAQAAAIEARFALDLQRWSRQDELGDAQTLARLLDDKAVFLIFGKFNAGKSSLCNFLAERFAGHGRPVRYFRIADGCIHFTEERLQEGATETTTALQGVCLGEGLVLLDTPGLHSVTPENAALTQRFTDSADGVLWLTSSASPGQVQELGELGRELRRGKALLPVVTRSDYLEEDEVDGEIVKLLRNKTPANRALQQADVQSRGREKLAHMGVDAALLRPPVSLSVLAARRQGQTAQALEQAGFYAFWEAFAALVAPALAYRRRKYAEMALHHRQEQVMHGLLCRQAPALDALLLALDAERAALQQRRDTLVRRVWREVAPELPDLLERHAPQGDLPAVCRALSDRLAQSLRQGCEDVLAGYGVTLDAQALQIAPAPAGMPGFAEHQRLHAWLEESARSALLRGADEAVRQALAALDALGVRAQAACAVVGRHRDALALLERALRAGVAA